MRLIDLTLPVPVQEHGHPTVVLDEWPITGSGFAYTGMVYHFNHWSMSGTYIDFPGHIKETDDGMTAENYPLERLVDVETTVIHLDRAERPGKVSASELERACPQPVKGGGLIVHALGPKRFDEVPERSVALSKDAVRWIIQTGVHLLVSDIYEHASEPEDVFWDLFQAGVSTVCCPINLDKIRVPHVKLTAITTRFTGVTQLSCRLFAKAAEAGKHKNGSTAVSIAS